MRNSVLIFALCILLYSCKTVIITNEKEQINNTLNLWHNAAAAANFNEYFSHLTDDAVFIGTDATENWKGKAFKNFCKPYFDKGKAWNFKSLDRNVYISKNNKMAWFDELLSTQMKICRGSGVLIKINNEWKIKHYVLSMTIPNEKTNEVIKIKEDIENQTINTINAK